MSNNNKNETPKRKITSRQVIAMIGVILLVLLYIITLFVAIFDSSSSGRWFFICIFCSIVVPIMIWFYARIWDRMKVKTDYDPDMQATDPAFEEVPAQEDDSSEE